MQDALKFNAGCWVLFVVVLLVFLRGFQGAIHIISYVHHVNVDQALTEGNPSQSATPTGCCLTSVLNKVTKWWKWSMGLTG